MHRLTITSNLFARPWVAVAALPAGMIADVLGPWATLTTVAVLVAGRAVTVTWPAEQAPAQEQAPMAEEATR